MPDIYRETRTYREREDSPSDDERRRTTLRRYKGLGPSGTEESDLRMEKRIERTSDGDVKIQRRYQEFHDLDGDGRPDIERYRKETEFYSPYDPSSSPNPSLVGNDPNIVVLREDPHRELEFGPYRRESEYAVGRRDRRKDYASDGDDDGYVVHHRRRRTTLRDRSSSSSSDDHKLHLAEGAIAGAGVTALLATRRSKHGELPENRGRKVIAGAALGALGTEAFKRARSAIDERYDRHRSPSRDRHSKIKTGLGIAAAALAVAGATQYYKASKVEKEEARRGRSRNRGYPSDGYYSSRSPSRKRSRSKSIAKAALATAATAGIVKHFRNKSKSRSRSRSKSVKGRSRSRSRLRTGAEIAAAAVAGGAAGKLYKKHKERRRSEPGLAPYLGTLATMSPGIDRDLDRAAGLVESRWKGIDPEQESIARHGRGSNGDWCGRHGIEGIQEQEEVKERERDVASDREAASAEERRERRRRDRDRRRYEDDARYDDDGYPPSPPHASGGYSGPRMSGANADPDDYSSYPPQTYFPPPSADTPSPYPPGPLPDPEHPPTMLTYHTHLHHPGRMHIPASTARG
ncbi:unnamed protein product [Parascedosporium putredinis]|uniref:DUF3824 domain-containing protein n=1 Tax=Parascedosporium putredinis TaxID=1442378 RepID=A0A9P1M9Z4_9PEZI|nr:unnamed protein product [Parascedosporium putredinis]CAI7995713.1 unnamed protein product [Parascedosporium putredinis]